MTIAEIKAEIAALGAQLQREPQNYPNAQMLRQAKRRREMLQAELSRLERLAAVPEGLRESLRRHFTADEVEKLVTMGEAELAQLMPQENK